MTNPPNIYREDGELPPTIARTLPPTVAFDAELGRGLHFTQTDLQANRAGHLTAGQTYRLALEIRRYYGRLTSGIAAIGLLWMAATFILPVPVLVTLCMSLFGVVFFSIALLLLLDRREKELQSVDFPVIQQADGPVRSTFPLRYWNSIWANIRINGQWYDVPPEGRLAFTDGTAYRVYYLRGSKWVISAEPITPKADAP